MEIHLGHFDYINERLEVLSKRCVDSLLQRGFHQDQIHTEPFLHMRYDRTDCALLCEPGSNTNLGVHRGDFHQSFTEKYSIRL